MPRTRTLALMQSLLLVAALLAAGESERYSFPQLKEDTAATFLAGHPVTFIKVDWIGGCGAPDTTFIEFAKALTGRVEAAFAVIDWNDYEPRLASGMTNSPIMIGLNIGGKAFYYDGPDGFHSLLAWAWTILAREGRAGTLARPPDLRLDPEVAVPAAGARLDRPDALFTFDKASLTNRMAQNSDGFDASGHAGYLVDDCLNLDHGYFPRDNDPPRPQEFTSTGFTVESVDFARGFTVVLDFKPLACSAWTNMLLFLVGSTPHAGIAIESNHLVYRADSGICTYDLSLDDAVIARERWNNLAVSFDFAAGRVRLWLNGLRMRDIAVLPGVSGKSFGVEAESCPASFQKDAFKLVYGRAGQMYSGRIDNLAFYGRPLSSAAVNRAHAVVRALAGSGSR